MRIASFINIIKKNKLRLFYPALVILAAFLIILINGYRDYEQSKSELNDLMRNQASSILRTIIVSSQNTLLSEEFLEGSIKEKLLNNAEKKKTTSLDNLIDHLVRPGEIVYYALQDENGIIISSANVAKLDKISESIFLQTAVQSKKFFSRVYNFNARDVFEAVQNFQYKGESIGILRIGLSLNYLNQLNSRAFNRILISSIILILSAVILLAIIYLGQNYKVLKKQYHAVETFSGDVIKTVSDAIIVFDDKNKINVFNKAAEELFVVRSEYADNINSIISKNYCPEIYKTPPYLINVNCRINNSLKNLLVSGNSFYDENNILNTVLIIRDLSNIKKLEMQLQRKERLTAMGALASGVAHEIRNPLNSIGTIAQQLNKDFASVENKEEYQKLTKIVYSEVKRINETITNFLRFAKPDPLVPVEFNLIDLVYEVVNQYTGKLRLENISLKVIASYEPIVIWDKNQIKQVFINLIENAKDAIKDTGEIKIELIKSEDPLRIIEIKISDSGTGIPEEIKNKIFNLYYTTKAAGTGIGLSIVQKIIDEHNGVISFESGNIGTVFTLQMPDKIS